MVHLPAVLTESPCVARFHLKSAQKKEVLQSKVQNPYKASKSSWWQGLH